MISELEFSDGTSMATVSLIGDTYLYILWHEGTVVDIMWSKEYDTVKQLVDELRGLV